MDAVAQLNTALAGRYRVEREIGRGGMAVVYLARDEKHNRRVALKVLNPELGAVLGVERFLAEIQVTANLQHPNLLPLFDSGEAEGLLFYVMPYVEGEGLRDKLAREKQLPIEEAIHIAVAVASALDYAHRHGVIHRDLKPENILLQDGQPMVADFGIALAVSNAGGNRITQTGLSLGTPQYMSPEQATGDRTIDGRTDIYSLGAMLYEMLTGEPPHTGSTAQSVIAKVITDKPRSIRLARDTVPEHIEGAVERALAKLPADRFATAHEFSDALVGKSVMAPSSFSTTAARSVTARRSPVMTVLPWFIAAGAVASAGIAWGTRSGTGEARPLRYEVRLPPQTTISTGLGNSIALGSGGRFLAFAANRDGQPRMLYLRADDDLNARMVPGSELAARPFFSPDGEWVAFFSGGQLKRASVGGGGAVLLSEFGGTGSWSPSGRIVIANNSSLFWIPATGGQAVRLSSPDTTRGETAQQNPVALSDGKTALYTSLAMGGAAAARIGIVSLEDGKTHILDVQGSVPLGYMHGHIIYTTAAGTVMATPVDLGAREVTGVSVPVIDQVAVESGNPTTYAYLSPDGSLVHLSALARRELTLVSADGERRTLVAERESYSWPRLAPDGSKLALTRSSSARSDIYIYTMPSGPMERLSTTGSTNDRPEWTADSRSVIYRSNRGGNNAAWIHPVDGSGEPRLLHQDRDSRVDEAVLSPDGKYLLYQRDRSGRGELMVRGLGTDTASRRVGTGAFGEVGGRFSPDGKWVAFTSSESGTSQVYVRPFPALNARYQVSLNGGATPVWSRDGRTLYYVAERQLMAATIGRTLPFSISNRRVVLDRSFTFQGIHADYDVTADGGLVALRPDDESAQVVVVRNWSAEVAPRLKR